MKITHGHAKRWIPIYVGLFLVGALGAVAWAKPWNKKHSSHSSSKSFSYSFGMGDGLLGADVQSMTEDLRGYFGAPKDKGVLVSAVEQGSDADKAGLQTGDVITDVEGDSIDDPGDLFGALADKQKGDDVKLTVVRGKKQVTLTAKLTDDPMAGMSSMGANNFNVVVPPVHLNMNMPHGGVHMMGPNGFAVGFGNDDLEEKLDKAQQKIDSLEKRLDALEKKVK
jgi:hypothetical protein